MKGNEYLEDSLVEDYQYCGGCADDVAHLIGMGRDLLEAMEWHECKCRCKCHAT